MDGALCKSSIMAGKRSESTLQMERTTTMPQDGAHHYSWEDFAVYMVHLEQAASETMHRKRSREDLVYRKRSSTTKEVRNVLQRKGENSL